MLMLIQFSAPAQAMLRAAAPATSPGPGALTRHESMISPPLSHFELSACRTAGFTDNEIFLEPQHPWPERKRVTSSAELAHYYQRMRRLCAVPGIAVRRVASIFFISEADLLAVLMTTSMPPPPGPSPPNLPLPQPSAASASQWKFSRPLQTLLQWSIASRHSVASTEEIFDDVRHYVTGLQSLARHLQGATVAEIRDVVMHNLVHYDSVCERYPSNDLWHVKASAPVVTEEQVRAIRKSAHDRTRSLQGPESFVCLACDRVCGGVCVYVLTDVCSQYALSSTNDRRTTICSLTAAARCRGNC